MKNIFGVNVKEAEAKYDGEAEFAARRLEGELRLRHGELTEEIKTLQNRASLPLWLLIAIYILLGYGAICVFSFLTAPLGENAVSYAQSYANAPWVVWSGLAALVAGGALMLVNFYKGRKVEKSGAIRDTAEQVEKFTAESRETLMIPTDAADCDVLVESYRVRRNGKKSSALWMANYINGSFWAFREGDALCLADSTTVIKIPLEQIEKITCVQKRISFQGWHKEYSYREGRYRQYNIRANNSDMFIVKTYVSLQIRGTEEWEVKFPPYEQALIELLTGKHAE